MKADREEAYKQLHLKGEHAVLKAIALKLWPMANDGTAFSAAPWSSGPSPRFYITMYLAASLLSLPITTLAYRYSDFLTTLEP